MAVPLSSIFTLVIVFITVEGCSQPGGYVVQLGDTLFSIARQHQTTTTEILSLNKKSTIDWDLLGPGDVICLPADNTIEESDPGDDDAAVTVDVNSAVDAVEPLLENPNVDEEHACTTLPSPITAGVESFSHAWPWQVLIGMADANGTFPDNSFCGGVLIGNQTVLTAAHCVVQCIAKGLCIKNNKKASGYRVGLGVHKRSKFTNFLKISKLYVHKDYNYENKHQNDVAILKLARPVKFTRKIQPIRLPDEHFRLCAGAEVIVTGWGATDVQSDASDLSVPERLPANYSDILRQGRIRTVDSAVCSRILGGLFSNVTMLCAGTDGGGTDACQNDSGGPLVAYDPKPGSTPTASKSYVLVGLVSWGIGCGTADSPGVYTSIPYLVPWIRQIQKLGQMDGH